jgi:membrane-associated phospholipid phosphatase
MIVRLQYDMSKYARIIIIVCGLFFLLLFAGYSKLVKQKRFTNIDFAATVKIQDRMPHRFDEVWEDIAFFVSPMPSIVLVGLLTIVALVDWKNKKVRLRALVIPLLFGALVLGEIYGKNVVHHPAPPFFMIKNPTTIFPKYYINEQFSYPSGHTARAVFLGFVFLSLVASHLSLAKRSFGKWIAIGGIMFLYVVAVAIGRIYLGHHWLSDILGGTLLGTATALPAVALVALRR